MRNSDRAFSASLHDELLYRYYTHLTLLLKHKLYVDAREMASATRNLTARRRSGVACSAYALRWSNA